MDLFPELALSTLKKVEATFNQRGEEYGDTWRDCQWLNLRAVLKELGIEVSDYALRPIVLAGLVDLKHQRMQGGWKYDNPIDGIAYTAALAEEMRRLQPHEDKPKSPGDTQ